MKLSQILLFASFTLVGASCVDQDLDQGVDQDQVSTTSDDLTSRAARPPVEGACTVLTPTSWYVNGSVCSYPWPGTFPLQLGESIQIDSYHGGGGFLELYCDETGLHLVQEVCSGTCELCV
jgi:hypothetical protein